MVLLSLVPRPSARRGKAWYTLCVCVNFMNAHVMKNCGRVYGNGLKLTHAVSETENYARVYESDV